MKTILGLSALASIAEAVYFDQLYDPRPINLAQLLAAEDLDDESDGEPTVDVESSDYEAESWSPSHNPHITGVQHKTSIEYVNPGYYWDGSEDSSSTPWNTRD